MRCPGDELISQKACLSGKQFFLKLAGVSIGESDESEIDRALVSVTLEPDAHVHVKVATKADRLTWLLERRIVSPRAVLILLQAESPVVRREAACALTPLAGEPTVRDALRKCLKDPDWWVRCAAIDALAQHAGEPRSEDCQSGPQGQSSQ